MLTQPIGVLQRKLQEIFGFMRAIDSPSGRADFWRILGQINHLRVVYSGGAETCGFERFGVGVIHSVSRTTCA
jgi:hypothetical protein